MVAGEGSETEFLNSAELYDPATGKWSVTGHLTYTRNRRKNISGWWIQSPSWIRP